MIDEETMKASIILRTELSTEHFEAVRYILSRVIRKESDEISHHNRMIKYAQEILIEGEKTFRGGNRS
jgi:hypothetical protein